MPANMKGGFSTSSLTKNRVRVNYLTKTLLKTLKMFVHPKENLSQNKSVRKRPYDLFEKKDLMFWCLKKSLSF